MTNHVELSRARLTASAPGIAQPALVVGLGEHGSIMQQHVQRLGPVAKVLKRLREELVDLGGAKRPPAPSSLRLCKGRIAHRYGLLPVAFAGGAQEAQLLYAMTI